MIILFLRIFRPSNMLGLTFFLLTFFKFKNLKLKGFDKFTKFEILISFIFKRIYSFALNFDNFL